MVLQIMVTFFKLYLQRLSLFFRVGRAALTYKGNFDKAYVRLALCVCQAPFNTRRGGR